MPFETQSILVPIYYGRDQADEAVIQMGKKITHVRIVGNYLAYQQFKCPTRCLRKVVLVNDIKILQVQALYF